MDNNVSVNINLTPEQVAAGEADLQNGTILKITSGSDDIGGDFNEFEMVQHPVIELAGLMLREEVGTATDLSLMNLLKTIVLLASATPGMSMLNLLEIVSAALPWQTTLVTERMRLGLSFDEQAFPGQGAIQPSMNINITTPEIRLPEQAAPVVNIQSKLEMPVTEEVINVERDANGFIQSATKIRLPIG